MNRSVYKWIRILLAVLLVLTQAPQRLYAEDTQDTEETVHVTGITLNETALSIVEGRSRVLQATIEPADATDKTIRWYALEPDVATVADGQVKAVAPGTAYILAVAADGGYMAFCKVTVTAKPVAVTGISIDPAEVTVRVGETTQVRAIISPENATNRKVNWLSTEPQTASVDSNGTITGIKAGTVLIAATSADGGYTAMCTVHVEPAAVPVTGIILNKTALTLRTGKSETLTASVTPDNASDKTVTWTSSNTAIAKVDAAGKVTAVADKGTKDPSAAVITASAADGTVKATCTVTVEDPVNAFVRRLYQLCFNRKADDGGFRNWTTKLKNRTITAADAVQGFFLSKEMNNLNLSNEDFVERCYRVMMNRASDAGGKKNWVSKLNSGTPKTAILQGFVASREFTKICADYGIERGNIPQ